jgi:hypothetical protein
MDLMDTGMDTTPGIKKAIYICTRDTRIHVPGGFLVPVSITSHENVDPFSGFFYLLLILKFLFAGYGKVMPSRLAHQHQLMSGL